jgi:hypothetical protein
MYLTGSQQLQLVVTGSPVALGVLAEYLDHSLPAPAGATAGTSVVAAGTTTIVGSPAVGVDRQVHSVSVVNTGTVAVTVQAQVSPGPIIASGAYSLGPGEALIYSERGDGWQVRTRTGSLRGASLVGVTGWNAPFYKTTTAPEAAGVPYLAAKDGGGPGAWAPGTPGLAGRAIVSEAGRLVLPTAVGPVYMARLEMTANVVGRYSLVDLLLVNSGLVVTTLTAQTVNTVALPPRDLLGTAAGVGVFMGLLVTTATTNAAAIGNITASYTNSAGVPGRTATMVSFPATAVAGTLVYFLLAAGDDGVQSVQSVTIGTSLLTGAVSLLLFRELASVGVSQINMGFAAQLGSPGVATYAGSTLVPLVWPSTTTAINITGAATFNEVS